LWCSLDAVYNGAWENCGKHWNNVRINKTPKNNYLQESKEIRKEQLECKISNLLKILLLFGQIEILMAV